MNPNSIGPSQIYEIEYVEMLRRTGAEMREEIARLTARLAAVERERDALPVVLHGDTEYRLVEYRVVRMLVDERDALRADLASMTTERDDWKDRAQNAYRASIGEVWHWQGDAGDHPESLTCPVLMSAEQARTIAATRALLRRMVEAANEIRMIQDEFRPPQFDHPGDVPEWVALRSALDDPALVALMKEEA